MVTEKAEQKHFGKILDPKLDFQSHIFIFFIFSFNFLGMVAHQLKRNCFTGGHAFRYSKNLINNLQLMKTNKKKIKIKRVHGSCKSIKPCAILYSFCNPF